MKRFLPGVLFILALCGFQSAVAEPDYKRIEMEIDVETSANDLWAIVGGYCDIQTWLNIDCEISSGDGNIGTVRVLLGGKITEILVAQTDLSYGYTQPAEPGEHYNLYHGFMEAKPVDANTSKLRYTVVYDVSNLPDQAAREADMAARRGNFEAALKNMKALAEAAY